MHYILSAILQASCSSSCLAYVSWQPQSHRGLPDTCNDPGCILSSFVCQPSDVRILAKPGSRIRDGSLGVTTSSKFSEGVKAVSFKLYRHRRQSPDRFRCGRRIPLLCMSHIIRHAMSGSHVCLTRGCDSPSMHFGRCHTYRGI